MCVNGLFSIKARGALKLLYLNKIWNFCKVPLESVWIEDSQARFFARNRHVTSGAQIRKLAKPRIKKVGTSLWGTASVAQMRVSAEPAHNSIIAQNRLSVIFSIIMYLTSSK
jgi:hypothetical protein